MGSHAGEIERHVVTHPVGADVVQSGIHHPCCQWVDLDIAGAEVMPFCTRQWDVQRTLA